MESLNKKPEPVVEINEAVAEDVALNEKTEVEEDAIADVPEAVVVDDPITENAEIEDTDTIENALVNEEAEVVSTDEAATEPEVVVEHKSPVNENAFAAKKIEVALGTADEAVEEVK
jgi:hypothetical protein